MIRFKCSNPSCAFEMEADDSAGGQKAECPRCKTMQDIPFPDYLPSMSCISCNQSLPPQTADKAGTIVQCPHCKTANVIPGKGEYKGWLGCLGMLSLIVLLASSGLAAMLLLIAGR